MVRAVDAAVNPSLLVLGGAVLLDRWLRVPSAWHPVAWFGRAAQWWFSRVPTGDAGLELGLGLILALSLPALASAVTGLLLGFVWSVHPLPAALMQVWLLYACVTLYGLLDAARMLDKALRTQGLEAARSRLSWLCSRDASQLDEAGLMNGAIESLAENLADSVVGPLLYLCCFGLPGAVAYRAINTLDAMVGYHGRYEWLGKAAARLDDVVNLVPARLTALLLWLAAASCGPSARFDLRAGLAVWWADRARTPSPNGGHPMAMAAGLLGVKLDKPGVYTLGAALRTPTRADLQRSLVLCQRAGLLAFSTTACALWQLGSRLV